MATRLTPNEKSFPYWKETSLKPWIAEKAQVRNFIKKSPKGVGTFLKGIIPKGIVTNWYIKGDIQITCWIRRKNGTRLKKFLRDSPFKGPDFTSLALRGVYT